MKEWLQYTFSYNPDISIFSTLFSDGAGIVVLVPIVALVGLFFFRTQGTGRRRLFSRASRAREFSLAAGLPGLVFSSGPAGELKLRRGAGATSHRDHPCTWAEIGSYRIGRRMRTETQSTSSTGDDYSRSWDLTQSFVELPLDLGLGLYFTHAPSASPGSAGAGFGITLGEEAIDRDYWISGQDPDDVRRLFRDPAVLSTLRTLVGAEFRLSMSDRALWIERDGRADGRLATLDAHRLVKLASALVQAYRGGRPWSYEQALEATWAPLLAAGRHLRLDLDMKGLSGAVGGCEVSVDLMREVSNVQPACTSLKVRFPSAPAVAFMSLSRQQRFDLGSALGIGDIRIGDKEFDKRFVVQGEPREALRAILDEEARQRLIQLQDMIPTLSIDRHGLKAELGAEVPEVRALSSMIIESVKLCTHLSRML